MALSVAKLRKLVALDEEDPLSRFALGQALFQEGSIEALNEAAFLCCAGSSTTVLRPFAESTRPVPPENSELALG